ncbi:hypothetical protein [Leptospira sp. GIMC2001]|uniref:hypothetical protein n=1 Tax=Leptospira sp. GIMC2001 TaxID=1513297 RepID=UPI00234A68AA|nr:hypothetical protein [Leptospira sp. GIMC2001]WCL47814.1 hypothetical protein O4O04_00730 [Leptospira sp. GIMC2001]
MISHTLLSVILLILTIVGYRYSFPYPFKEYLTLFIPLFAFGFIPNLLWRRWGRIFTIIGALSLVRFGSYSNALVTYPDWTTLHPLFWGAISGILVREILLKIYGHDKFKAGMSDKDPYLRRIALNSPAGEKDSYWKEPEVWFVFFVSILVLERFLEYHPWNWTNGITLTEGFYFKGLSYRSAFGLTWMLWDSIIPVTWYIFTEERTSKNNDNPSRIWLIGLSIVFVIQAVIILIQTSLSPNFMMQNTNLSLISGRVAGLFRDSGSASWIFPVLGLFLAWKVREKKGVWREPTRVTILSLILVVVFCSGFKLGKTFWLTYSGGLYVLIGLYIIQKIQYPKLWIAYTFRTIAMLMILAATFTLVWFGENQKLSPSFQKTSLELKQLVRGESIRTVESYRYDLTKASVDLFTSHPYFGSGFGSMIVHLKDPKSLVKVKPKDQFVDSPANFYLGWLGETGMLGMILLCFYLGLNYYIRDNIKYSILLILPLMTGYQIVHPDGGAFLMMMVLATRVSDNAKVKLKVYADKAKMIWAIIAIGISLHYLALMLIDK